MTRGNILEEDNLMIGNKSISRGFRKPQKYMKDVEYVFEKTPKTVSLHFNFRKVVKKMNDNFILYKNMKKFFVEVMDYTNNIPRDLSFVKIEISRVFENAIRYLHYYAVNIDKSYKIKEKYLKDLIVEISLVDFYMGFLYEKRVLGKERYKVFLKNLEEIRKLAYGVINSEKKLCQI